MKTKQRRKFGADFKARVVLEAIKGQRTVQEIASHYGVHPNQVTTWKRQAIEQLPEVFADHRLRGNESDEVLKAALYQQIGQLQMELDWLKKKSGLSR
jgi:transposase-like protein